LIIGAFKVSVYDSAHARTPPSAGLTVPWIEPSLNDIKANNPAMAAERAASRKVVIFIT
jgi:hypothetical protein